MLSGRSARTSKASGSACARPSHGSSVRPSTHGHLKPDRTRTREPAVLGREVRPVDEVLEPVGACAKRVLELVRAVDDAVAGAYLVRGLVLPREAGAAEDEEQLLRRAVRVRRRRQHPRLHADAVRRPRAPAAAPSRCHSASTLALRPAVALDLVPVRQGPRPVTLGCRRGARHDRPRRARTQDPERRAVRARRRALADGVRALAPAGSDQPLPPQRVDSSYGRRIPDQDAEIVVYCANGVRGTRSRPRCGWSSSATRTCATTRAASTSGATQASARARGALRAS